MVFLIVNWLNFEVCLPKTATVASITITVESFLVVRCKGQLLLEATSGV